MIKIGIWGLWITAIMSVSGCVANGTNLVKNGSVTIDSVVTDKVFVSWAEAYQDANNLIVAGVVKQSYPSYHSIETHVDITVLDAQGRVLHQAITKPLFVPIKRPGKGGAPWVRFELTMPVVVPEKATIRAVCHSGEHPLKAI